MTGELIRENFEALQRMAEGAALMTDTTRIAADRRHRLSRHFNRPIAEAMYENIRAVGMPDWSEDDQTFARAFQEFMEADEIMGLKTEVDELGEPPEGLPGPAGRTI